MSQRQRLGWALCWLSLVVCADHGVAKEYQVKAAYLYNVTKFFTWPDAAASDTQVNICVLGDNPFHEYIRKLENFQAKGHAIKVLLYDGINDEALANCHMAFFAASELANARVFLESVPERPILTVGEGDQFVDLGGLVGLVVVNNTIQLDINLTKAKAQGFSISANLLEVARTVK